MGMVKQNVYTVAQVNSYLKNMFTQDFLLAFLSIKGEVSNCKYHSSGHIYFTLKDAKGTLACVMFAGNRSGLSFQMEEGQQVIVSGTIDIYERDGKYQLYAKEIVLAGAGLLYERFEQLKKQLEEMGMFAQEYKRKIPVYINKLGVVTAPTGAVVQDIITIATRRNPYIQIIIYPAIVQGDQAPESIINGIRALEKEQADVIIVGRGGGSIEDLWAFNEEIVAQEIFNCSIPIISAVGHETDTTIADYVADLRAPTPSAAAELAVYDSRQLQEKIEQYEQRILRLLHIQLEKQQYRLDKLKLKLQYLNPKNQIREKRMYAWKLEEQFQENMQKILRFKRHELELYIEKMKGLSPLNKLNQGFAYITDEKNQMINTIEKIETGDTILIQVKDGSLKAKVKEKKSIRREAK